MWKNKPNDTSEPPAYQKGDIVVSFQASIAIVGCMIDTHYARACLYKNKDKHTTGWTMSSPINRSRFATPREILWYRNTLKTEIHTGYENMPF